LWSTGAVAGDLPPAGLPHQIAVAFGPILSDQLANRSTHQLHISMKIPQFTLALLAVAASATLVAQTDDQPGGDTAFLSKFGSSFEAGGEVPAKDFVPADLMSGGLHTVGERAYNDGLRNTYVVITDRGDYQVTGTPALVQFIREIYALDYLRGVSKSEEFGKALANAGKQKVQSVVGVVKDPIGTIKNVPKGASRFFGRIGEGLKGGKSESESGALASITGVAKAKRQIAAKLGVSPYTTNEALQEELSSVARASAGGGLLLTGATAAVGGGFGAVLSVVGVNQTLQEMLVNSTPEDLRMANRKKLLALGASHDLTEEFLAHPWFSPWHETITTDALARIGANPNAFLATAVRALTVEDAFYFQRVAQLLAQYSGTVARLKSIRSERGIICGLDGNGTLIVPVSLDYAIWAERTARRTEEFAALAGSGDIKALAFWTDGRISQQLGDELKKRGIAFQTLALDAAAR
jgi:hypothetical protein